jgi:hypothetical protein
MNDDLKDPDLKDDDSNDEFKEFLKELDTIDDAIK